MSSYWYSEIKRIRMIEERREAIRTSVILEMLRVVPLRMCRGTTRYSIVKVISYVVTAKCTDLSKIWADVSLL